MTDRLKGVYVAFDRDIRDDDAESIIKAIEMVRGVAGVTPNISTAGEFDARCKVREEIREDLLAMMKKLSRL